MTKVGGRCVPVALVALLAAACSTETATRPDGGSDPGQDGGGPGPDAPVGSAGLVLEFRGIPALPAALGGVFDPELDQVRLELEDVRAVGDAAPGDERTSRDELRLEWRGGDGEGEGEGEGGDDGGNDPVVVTFDQAPPGLYSSVFAELVAYQLEGSVTVEGDGGGDRDFEIEDSPSTGIAISIPLGGVTLEAGETRRVTIEVSCAAAVLDTPWDQVEEDDGELVVDGGSPEIDAVRGAMAGAFTYQGDDVIGSGQN
jgi:hypothetical protein